MLTKLSVLICLSGLVSACALQVVMPGPIVESPLVNGENANFDLEAGWHQAQSILAVRNGSARPYTQSNPQLVEAGEVYAKGLLGLGERFEMGLAVALPGSFLLNGKYQFLGDPRSQKKKGNFAGSIFTAVGTGFRSNGGDQEYLFGPGGKDWHASGSGNTIGFGFSVGYQPADLFVLYTGYARYYYTMTYQLDQSATDTYPAATYSGTSRGSAESVALGFEYGNKFVLNLAGQYDWRYWDANPVNGALRADASVKFMFR